MYIYHSISHHYHTYSLKTSLFFPLNTGVLSLHLYFTTIGIIMNNLFSILIRELGIFDIITW